MKHNILTSAYITFRLAIACLLAAMPVLLAGCVGEEPAVGRLAMEAWIDTDGYPVVILTRTITPGDAPVPVSEAVARFAKVTITDGTDTVTLTGGIDYSVFPPYSYRNFDMKGRTGHRYTVTAQYDGMRISATSLMLPPPEIDSLVFHPASGKPDMLTGRVHFTPAQTDTTTYYVVFTRVRNRETRHYPGMFGTTEVTAGTDTASVPLSRGINVLADFEPDFHRGDTVDVILAHVEPVAYRFWQAYNDAVYFGDNIFVSTAVSLPSNITGGLGLFSARGTSRRLTVIR